jgi:hypothetical protein
MLLAARPRSVEGDDTGDAVSNKLSLLVTIGPVLALAEIAFVANQRWMMAAIGAALLLAFGLGARIASQLHDAEHPVVPIEDAQGPERSGQTSARPPEL